MVLERIKGGEVIVALVTGISIGMLLGAVASRLFGPAPKSSVVIFLFAATAGCIGLLLMT